MKKRLRLFFVSCVGLMVASSLLVGCHKTDDPTPVVELMARNTIIIYMAGENTLADIVELDSAEIAAGVAKLPDSTRVVVYIDDTHSSRILVGSRNKPLRLAKTYGRNICSTDSTDMEQVFTDIYRDYPSRHYGLVFWSHASGWIPERQQAPRRRTFGIDNNRRNANSDLGTKMAVQTLACVLAHHQRPDYIFFDACFMQCIEVAYELRHVTDYIVGSPAEVPADGAPYSLMLPLMAERQLMEAVRTYYDYYTTGEGAAGYGGVELSVVRTASLESLVTATRPLLQQLLAGRTELYCRGVQHYYPYSGSELYPDYYDIVSLFYNHLPSDVFTQWRRQFDEAVPLSLLSKYWDSAFARSLQIVYDTDHCGGVSVFVPSEDYVSTGWVDAYHDLEWYRANGLSATGW